MKKLINLSLIYAIAGMIGGVFFREFTKFNHFTGVTFLGKVHTHLLVLGAIVFLIVALFEGQYSLSEQKKYRLFYITYNIGLPLTTIMMVVRGVVEVLNISLSSGMNSAISGIAGVGHIFLGIGFIVLILTIKDAVCLEKR